MEVSWSQPENHSHRVFCWAIRLFGLPNPAHHGPAEQLLFRCDGLNCAHENICDYGLKPHARAQGGWWDQFRKVPCGSAKEKTKWWEWISLRKVQYVRLINLHPCWSSCDLWNEPCVAKGLRQWRSKEVPGGKGNREALLATPWMI